MNAASLLRFFRRVMHWKRWYPWGIACALLGMGAQAHARADTQLISIEANRTPLESVFNEVKKQSGYRMVYNTDVLARAGTVTLSLRNAPLEVAMERILDDRPLGYELKENTILVFPKDGLSRNGLPAAQQREISGSVRDAQGQPLPGSAVLVKGTNRQVSANNEGRYAISASAGEVLVFRRVGYQALERTVGSQGVIDVTLTESVTALEEVTVSTGYQDIKKRMFTGASQNLKMADVKVEGTTDISRMLQGRAAGVNIQNVSGTFGSAPRVTIRGGASILGQTSPLWVIDGVVREDIVEQTFNDLTSGDSQTLIGSSLAGINANDIESFEVLRDAAATSLYGARALNGVIVIKTKGGRRGTPVSVNYNTELTMRTVPSYVDFDVLNSYESMGMLTEQLEKGYFNMGNIANTANSGVLGMAYDRMRTYDAASGRFLLGNTRPELNRFLQQYEMANTDWFDVLFKNSVQQQHSLSFNGGGTSNAFYASVGFLHDPGWSMGENVSQLSFNAKNTFFFSDKVEFTLSTLSSVRQQRVPGTLSAQDDTYFGSVTRDFDINPFNYALSTTRMLRPYDAAGNKEYYTANFAPFNILNELDRNTMEIGVRDFQFQGDFKYKILEKLDFSTVAAARFLNSEREHKMQEGSNAVQAYRVATSQAVREANRFLFTDLEQIGFVPVPVLENGGIYKKNDNALLSYYLRNSLHYADRLNEVHDIDVLAAQEIRYINRQSPNFTGYGLQFSRGNVPFTDPRIIEKLINEGESYFGVDRFRERSAAFLVKATYAFDSRYIVSFSGRYDGSNRQGEAAASRWIPTWTTSAKWNVYGERFMENVDSRWLSDLQVRGSYGLTANTGPATNAYAIFRNDISINRRLPTTRESMLNIAQLQNEKLTWEKQYAANIGLDLGFFNNRLYLSTELYQNNSFDLIDDIMVSGVGGELERMANNSDLKTRGVEFTLSGSGFKWGEFSWSSMVNFGIYHQEITKIQLRPRVFDMVRPTGGNLLGYPRNSLFSLDMEGLTNQGLPQFNIIKDGKPITTITDVNMQDREKLADYLIYEGAVDPNMTTGLSNNFRYKGWSFSFFLYASTGNVIRLNPIFSYKYAESFVPSRDFVNRWLLPGDEAVTDVPAILDNRIASTLNNVERAYNSYNYSTARVGGGDFIRVRNISFGYDLPAKLLERYRIGQLTLRLAATNPWLLYSDKRLNGADPEFFNSGGVAMPVPKQYILSLNARF